MLLRSSSSTLLDSWKPNSCGSSPESDLLLLIQTQQLIRTRSVSMSTSFGSDESPTKKTSPTKHKKTPKLTKLKEKEVDSGSTEVRRLLSNSGLGKAAAAEEEKGRVLQSLVAGGGGGDAYYQKMIESNPGNGLLLANYARFLKETPKLKEKEVGSGSNEVRRLLSNSGLGKAVVAEEEKGRVLQSLVAGGGSGDAARAHTYFDPAVKSDPDDCYVLASYARFLWDAEEQDENEGKEELSRQFGIQKGIQLKPKTSLVHRLIDLP
ncbi:hypothetical protein RND71_017432 [Anisodus tanguticus]|uniref:Uncharacterized protein n=1 Tax=Anisodus tanguticus TaxID=243964 RepID=A0AAE1S2B2_9SOLA|nr:hypothetical protein RND71_017432 [Anisodus tanguticus]